MKPNCLVARIQKAFRESWEASRKLHNKLQLFIPNAAFVEWSHGKHTRSGVVLGVAGSRVLIRLNGGKEAWVSAFRLTKVTPAHVHCKCC